MYALVDTYASHGWTHEIVYTMPCRGYECGTPVLCMTDDDDICAECDGWTTECAAEGARIYASLRRVSPDEFGCPECGSATHMGSDLRCMNHDCLVGNA